jgi:serine/threonine protein kinase
MLQHRNKNLYGQMFTFTRHLHCRLGTIDYLSPEILDCPVKQHPQDHKVNPQKFYDCKVDVWSIGVLAYELLLGRTPFEAVSI